ncbi:hypothetical protein RI367_003227 [Sorochytrium milnesiophthora]
MFNFRAPASRYGKSFLLLSFVQALVIIVLESIVGADYIQGINVNDPNDASRGVPVYIVIFVLSQCWNIVLAWEAMHMENTIQLISYVLFNILTFFYSLFQLTQLANQQAGQLPLLISIPVITGLCTLLHGYLAYKLYLEFGWRIYKRIGADPNMKNMFRSYQVFLTVLKLDVFFWFAFSIQYLVLVLQRNDAEWAITIAALPFTAAILVGAAYGLKRENKPVMLMFMAGLCLGMAYFIFKIVRVWTASNSRLYFTQKFLTFFAALSIVMILVTLVNSIICYRNFGRGLLTHTLVSGGGLTIFYPQWFWGPYGIGVGLLALALEYPFPLLPRMLGSVYASYIVRGLLYILLAPACFLAAPNLNGGMFIACTGLAYLVAHVRGERYKDPNAKRGGGRGVAPAPAGGKGGKR